MIISMKIPTILVIDIGLTNCKVVLFRFDGSIVDRATVAYPTLTPRNGSVEQDPESWWLAIKSGLDQIRVQSERYLEQIEAISVTGHMHSLVCIDAQGNALGNALVLGDQRSIDQSNAIIESIGLLDIYIRTGARMDASMPMAKIDWIRQNEPDRFARTSHFVTCKDYLRMRMTGDRLTDAMDATGTSLYNVLDSEWDTVLCDRVGINVNRLPQIVDCIEIAGSLLDDTAKFLGLKSGIPVVVGAGDDVEVLGFGLDRPGTILEHMGTTGSILACTSRPIFDPDLAIEVYPHLIPELWLLGGSISTAGRARSWADGILTRDGREGMDDEPPTRPNSDEPLLFIPHLAGSRSPHWDASARGSWLGLSINHTARDLYQAVQEGSVFALRSVLERIEVLMRHKSAIRVSEKDGSEDWMRMRSNIYGRIFEPISNPEPTALGAMILAAVGIEVYPDIISAIHETVSYTQSINPDDEVTELYDVVYSKWVNAESTVRSLL